MDDKMKHRTNRSIAALLLMLASVCRPPSMVGQNELAPQASEALWIHSVGAGIGVNDFHQKDTYLSPYIYRGPMFSSRLTYCAASASSRHMVDTWFSKGGIDSDVQPRDVIQTNGSFSYSYLHSVYAREFLRRPLEFFLGIGCSSTVFNTDFTGTDAAYHYQVTDRSWNWAHALNLHLRAEYHADDQTRISLHCSSPVMQLVSRPGNGHYYNERNADVINNFFNAARGGAPEYFWSALVVSGEIGLTRQLSGSIALSASYRFGYCSNDRPLPSQLFMNDYLGGLIVQL
jgi:hypothetical protein